MAVLTVGAGGEFQTISAAVAAAQDGDQVEVAAGTYTNNVPTITSSITLEAVGGMVTIVATEPPPNGKAIIDERSPGANVTNGGDATISGNIILNDLDSPCATAI
ncbi:MAG: hypothetical protein P4M09_05655 [Devosia sp.]|nr:hypothetical protein [Devosia sp.]